MAKENGRWAGLIKVLKDILDGVIWRVKEVSLPRKS